MNRPVCIFSPETIIKFCNHETNTRELAQEFGCTQTSVCRALRRLGNPEVNKAMARNVPDNLKKLSDISKAKYPQIDAMILAGEKVDYIAFVLKVSACTVTKRRKALGYQGVKGRDIITQNICKENAVA